ncbi:CBS domain-containing protein [Dyella jiangningensis]|uniref:CBS domain-containing protein n=1 Tax=Dyella sp. AtDHG13 TaxID=1938897 RepID=UPI000888810E|nr:CBS domain-containing protein [Dyella sp. AtDHG13]PXV55841.1 CBS domain-containing protein [Dyella sp. AtDHG13]SDK54409.1 CBS domain-containing protein [Dyella jiangningensis]
MRTIQEVMTRDVKVIGPEQAMREAAMTMARDDIGSLPVGENGRLVGMITDRDIAIKGVAAGKDGDAPVRDVMSGEVRYCFEDEDILHVAANMSSLGIRRLPVVNRDKQLVGIVALSNIVQGHENARDALLEGVAKPH